MWQDFYPTSCVFSIPEPWQLSANFMVVKTILFTHTTFLWATCCLICFITIVKPFLTLILTTGYTVYLIWKKGSRQVWSIDRGCLLLHDTWSHLWYIQRSVFVHSLICIKIEYCSSFLSFLLYTAKVYWLVEAMDFLAIFIMCFYFIIRMLNCDWLMSVKIHSSLKKIRTQFYSIKVCPRFWLKFSLDVATIKNPSKKLDKFFLIKKKLLVTI
jgi:hypothetical protein